MSFQPRKKPAFSTRSWLLVNFEAYDIDIYSKLFFSILFMENLFKYQDLSVKSKMSKIGMKDSDQIFSGYRVPVFVFIVIKVCDLPICIFSVNIVNYDYLICFYVNILAYIIIFVFSVLNMEMYWTYSLLMTCRPPSKVAILGFWSKKMRNVLKPMKTNFPIYIFLRNG